MSSEKRKVENEIFGVEIYDDNGGGITAVFSTYEKAKEYAKSIELNAEETCQIIGLTIDYPDKYDNLDYCRHGEAEINNPFFQIK